MAQNVLSISEFEDFNEWKRDGNVIRNSDGSYSTQDANFRNRLEDMEELQRYYKREFVGSYAKGGKLKVGDKFGNYSVTLYEPITYDDLGSSSGGKVKLVNQADFDTIIIQYDNALRGGEWFVSKDRKKYIGKNPQEVISKLNLNMENMYKIVDIDGDTVESNLNEQEVIDFADSLGYYEAQDNEEEPIYDIDSAISLIEMEGDYTVVKMSEYGGSVYADGGWIESLREEIQSKYGLRLEGNRVRTNFKSTAYEIAKKYDGEVQEDGSYYVVVFNEFAKGGKVDAIKKGDNVHVVAENKSGVVTNVIAKGKYFTVLLANGTKNVYDKKELKKVYSDDDYDDYAKGGNLVSDISTYVPHSKVLSITIKKGDKEYKLTGSDILDGVYVKDGEFKRGGVMKTLRRWWKKLNGTWYYNEGAGWRRDRKFQNKSEKYEKDGRSTYKQVTRGYVDDMPYEYADGGMTQKMFFGDASIEWKDRNGEQKSERFRKYIKAKNKGEAYRFFLKFIEDETNQFDENLVKNFLNVDEVETQDEMENALFMGYLSDKNYYAKGGYVDMREKLTKELMKLQRELNSSRLNSYFEGDTSEEEMARRRERESKLARFNDILATLNEMDKSPKYAKGGVVVTSIKDIPDFKEELNAGRISYRGLGMGKVADDFYKLAGESGTRIKVKGKEYFITDTEFDTFSRDASGRLRVRFDAPFRRFAKGGDVTVPEKIEYSSMFSAIPRSTDNENVV
jgi:hypothetical protein